VETAGKYKDAADSFSQDSMSPETREVMNSILDELYGNLVDAIAEGRRMKPEQVKALIDHGPFLATDAKSKGLLDDLLYEDEFYDKVKKDLKLEELRKIGHREYQKSLGGPRSGPKVAFLVGEGPILRGNSSDGWTDIEEIRSEAFIRLLRDIGKDEEVRGVVLRVNSPGGDAIASDEILREVRNLSKKKPLIVSMSDLAASGGYYIAMTGDPVLAYATTFTGSIGVVFAKPDIGGLYDKLGINVETLIRGRNADIDALHKPMSAAARAKLREGIDQTYRTFLERVAAGRHKNTAEIEPLAQGRVWLGAQAKRNGLIDEVGGLDRAMELLREKAKIAKNERLRIVPYPRRKSILEQLLGASAEDFERMAARWRFRGVFESVGLDEAASGLAHPELLMGGGILRLMPYTLLVR
jgi:protease-4